jgi:hypothetical protein
MKCDKVKRLLSDYLDNSLEESCKSEIKAHLGECRQCLDSFNTTKKVDNLLKLEQGEKPSEEYFENYWQKLRDKLQRKAALRLAEGKRRFGFFQLPRFSPAFSAVMIAALIFVNGFLYARVQELSSSVLALSKGEEEMQRQFSRFLTKAEKQDNITYLKIIENGYIIKFTKNEFTKKEVSL